MTVNVSRLLRRLSRLSFTRGPRSTFSWKCSRPTVETTAPASTPPPLPWSTPASRSGTTSPPAQPRWRAGQGTPAGTTGLFFEHFQHSCKLDLYKRWPEAFLSAWGVFSTKGVFFTFEKVENMPLHLWKKRPQFVKKEPLCGKIAPFVEKTPPDESGKSALHLWKIRPQLWKKSPNCEKSAPLWIKRPKCGKNAPGRKKPFRSIKLWKTC